MNELEIRDYFFSQLSTYGLKCGKKELTIEGLRIDIFAVGKDNTPYIIEFKRNKNRYMVGQAAQYLSLIQKYSDKIKKEINYNKMNWKNLKILCIAPDFYKRDFISSEYEPLKDKIHFYKFNVLQNNSNQMSGLNLEYSGPKRYGPLILPKELVPNHDLVQLKNEYYKITNTIARRGYYDNKILPLFNKIDNYFIKYKYIELFKKSVNINKFFFIYFSTSKEFLQGASLMINYFQEYIEYGFGINYLGNCYSNEAGIKLSKYFNNMDNCKSVASKILKFNDYYLCIANARIDIEMPVCELNQKELESLLNIYGDNENAIFYIMKLYERETMTINDVMNIINLEYLKFKFIFEIIM